MSRLPFRTSGRAGGPVLGRAVAMVEGLTAADLLAAFRGLPRGFWERDGAWSAWAGSAARIVVPGGAGGARFGEVRRRAEHIARGLVEAAPLAEGGTADALVRPRFHGGAVFDPRAEGARRRGNGSPGAAGAGGAWAGFPSTLFHLPAVELRKTATGVALAVTTAAPREGRAETAAAARRALRRVRSRLDPRAGARRGATVAGGEAAGGAGGRSSPEAPPAAPDVRSVRRLPEPRRWSEIVEAALGEIRAGRLEKVVPARMLEVELAEELDPVNLARRLRTASPAAIPFLVEPEPGRAFVGAAPEIVAALAGGRFHATAVAGTVADSRDPAERERLARRLLSSAKDRREHEVGVRDMRRALRRVAGVARVDREPGILRVRGVQHLLTNVTAEVPPGTHVLDVLEAMHPTAAVNGSPRDPARDFLRREEPFGRGWYAGPVGWFDTAGDGEFAPGLRSALIRGRRARMFAGAGIVAGSEPRGEWRETGLKLGTVLEAVGADAGELLAARAGPVAAGGR